MRFDLRLALNSAAIVSGGGGAGATSLVATDARGFSLDFLDNTYAVKTDTGAGALLYNDALGMALDFTDNTYEVLS